MVLVLLFVTVSISKLLTNGNDILVVQMFYCSAWFMTETMYQKVKLLIFLFVY